MLKCTKVITMDTKLHILHGSALTLRGVRWLVTEQSVSEPQIGRPVIKFHGLNTRGILTAAAEKYSGVFEILNALKSSTEPRGKVAKILEGLHYSNGGADDADLDEDGV